jgi:hypothetical protein
MTVRVGAFSLSAFVGGAERWMLDLIRHSKSPEVDWRWLVIGDESVNTAPILSEAASLLPVKPVSQLGVLQNEVDVIVGWGPFRVAFGRRYRRSHWMVRAHTAAASWAVRRGGYRGCDRRLP